MSAETQATAILETVGRSFSLAEREADSLVSHPVARLIAALPFLAGAEQPERTAAAHVATYVLSVRGATEVFAARPSDDKDILERLWAGTAFLGGDGPVIRRGLALLALCMIADYERDVEADTASGKHNPVAAGTWDAPAIRASLVETVESVPCAEMDGILSSAQAVREYWQW
jgi:hypothetical protein